LTRQPAVNTASSCAWDHTGRLFDLYGASPGSLYLVRPDGHVLGRWHAPRAATLIAAIGHVLHPQAR
jgi:3-(3-hydroxy-phenyl)propionate hydroxylase